MDRVKPDSPASSNAGSAHEININTVASMNELQQRFMYPKTQRLSANKAALEVIVDDIGLAADQLYIRRAREKDDEEQSQAGKPSLTQPHQR